MNVNRLNPEELRASLHLVLDGIMAHRTARGLSLDQERVTAIPGLFEERVTRALEETDEAATGA